MQTRQGEPSRWIFSRGVDLAVFGGSAALAFALLAVGQAAGLLDQPVPVWAWVATVLAVDVAHVWATLFRVYLDPREVRRRPALYVGAPVAVYAAGVALHAASARAFWTVLAYTAVFHFVRQQYGWVAMYKRRCGDRAPLDNALDTAAIYAATVYPIVWWHAHLPRAFDWFLAGDFVAAVPAPLAAALAPVHLAVMLAWAARQLYLALAPGRRVNAGKALVVATTWCCWYIGIVVTNSDYAFTVTNVLVHGVPYLALTWRYATNRYGARAAALADAARAGEAPREPGIAERVVARGAVAFVLLLVAIALLEEGLWDQLVWHDRAELFGDLGARLGPALLALVVPLLAVPQATHYVLDGWIWRAGPRNPELLRDLGLA